MKVILLEDVKKVGKKNEVVETSSGYGKNFLIKNKKAIEANDTNMKKLNNFLEEEKNNYLEDVKKANELKKEIEKNTFDFTLSKGSHGMVFGKISTKQIVSKLKEAGYEIDRKKIKSDGVNHLGEEVVEVELHKEVIAKIKINVIGE